MMSPEGYCTADYWFETLEEAFECSYEILGILETEWIS